MPVTVTWNTGPLDQPVAKWKYNGLVAGSAYLGLTIKRAIQIQGRPVSRRSLPGEAPRQETGELFDSWEYFVNAPEGYADVYSDLARSYTLEVGGPGTWGFVAPRPYIRRTLYAEEATIVILMTQPLP